MEAAVVLCTLGEILYFLEKRWGSHVPSSPVVLGSCIASFRGRGGGGGYKGGGNERDDDDDDENNDNNDDKEDEEDE